MGWSMTGRASVDNGFPLRPVTWHPWPVAGGRRRALRGRVLVVDDYITKPFSAKELVARIRARLRRRDTDGAETLRFHDIEMDVMAHQVTKGGKPVNLTPLEFELLATLARRPRQVFTREVLLEQVGGSRYAAHTRLVNVHVQRLRAKIEDDPENPRVVQTVRGVGYRIGPEGSSADAQAADQG